MTRLFKQRVDRCGREVAQSCARGNSVVEMALVLPVMIGLLLGVMDFGRAFYSAMAVTHAATVGAQYGAQSVEKSLDYAGMQSAAAAAATDISGFNATATRTCKCWSASAGAETEMMTCGSTCTSPSVLRVYVIVTGTGNFNTFVNYPGIPNSIGITRVARMRAQ
jgi:Flp pilus assembly protein TadG